jgi:predicted permease
MTGGDSNTHMQAEGFTPQREEDKEARYDQVAPGYFAVMGIPLLLGREVGAQDTATSNRICVINEELAKRFFAGRNPIGLHLTRSFGDRTPLEIVGVVKNSRSRSLQEDIAPRFYLPVDQGAEDKIAESVVFEIRTVGDPKAIVATVRKAILGVNPDSPISFAYSMDEVIADYTTFPRLIAQLCAIFGGLALLLAATGLYGVLSYGVARRTNEIGIRMALGADKSSVVGMILRETGVLVMIGLVAGIATAAGCAHLIASELYGLGQMDPATFVVAVGILGAVAFIAGYIPAARAAKVNPVQALRHE